MVISAFSFLFAAGVLTGAVKLAKIPLGKKGKWKISGNYI